MGSYVHYPVRRLTRATRGPGCLIRSRIRLATPGVYRLGSAWSRGPHATFHQIYTAGSLGIACGG